MMLAKFFLKCQHQSYQSCGLVVDANEWLFEEERHSYLLYGGKFLEMSSL